MRRVQVPSGRLGTVTRVYPDPARPRTMFYILLDDGEEVNLAEELVKDLEPEVRNGRPPKSGYPLGRPDPGGERRTMLMKMKEIKTPCTANKLAEMLGWSLVYVRRRLMELRRDRKVYLRWVGRTPNWSIR